MQHFDSFRLDTADECLWHEDAQIALPPKQFAVLRYLVEHPGRLISHDELLDAVWPETYVQPQVLRTYVLELRKILGDDARQPRFIQSLPKRGYRFVARVTSSNGSSPPPSTSPVCSGTLVGRAEELKVLSGCLERLAQAKRQVHFVSGETGIGKTALIDTFCRAMPPVGGAAVVRGQCVHGFAERETYYPVMEALGELCAPPHADWAKPVFARKAPAWLAALECKVPVQAALTEERAVSDLCGALETLAADRSLVVVFEDLQWADVSTLKMIAALARRRTPARLMILATVGPHSGGEMQELKRVKHDLLVHELCTEIALGPLRHAQIEELLRGALEQEDLPHALAGFVHQSSEGNPLFATAILRHLKAERFLVLNQNGEQKRWEQRAPYRAMEAGVPEELAQMIELEIERLAPPEQRMLEAGSLFHVAFPAWAVAAAMEQDLAAVEEACDELTRHIGFVKRAGQDELPDGTRSTFYVFVHGLYREVLYHRQSLTRRSRSHLRVAEQLRASFAGCESSVAREVAWHYEAAGERLRAIETLRCAARSALERKAYPAATDLLEYALRVTGDLHAGEQEAAAAGVRVELSEARTRSRAAECLSQET
jgi:predicted ATPase/DNA-binding winged helix-turn-helix (wHTH) protein